MGDRAISTGVRFPDDLYGRLRAAADDHDVSVNWLVNYAVTDYLDRLKPAKEVQWTRP
jgi:predicted transcriptional regulator